MARIFKVKTGWRLECSFKGKSVKRVVSTEREEAKEILRIVEDGIDMHKAQVEARKVLEDLGVRKKFDETMPRFENKIISAIQNRCAGLVSEEQVQSILSALGDLVADKGKNDSPTNLRRSMALIWGDCRMGVSVYTAKKTGRDEAW